MQYSGWWSSVCELLGWSGGGLAGELVKVVVHSTDQGVRLSVYLNWSFSTVDMLYYELSAWKSMLVPPNEAFQDIVYSIVSVNMQGRNRTKEISRTRWCEVINACGVTNATVLMLQETWGSKQKADKRTLVDFWHVASSHDTTGQGLEIWVNRHWGRKQTVLQDSIGFLAVAVDGLLGLGVVVTVHAPQRCEENAFKDMLVAIGAILESTPHRWSVLGGDWNRDIRHHTFSVVWADRFALSVAFMENNVHLPKDFVLLQGLSGQQVGVWQEGIADHPTVWVWGKQAPQVGTTGSSTRPVTPGRWDDEDKQYFRDILEAMSMGVPDPALWLHEYRNCISLVNSKALALKPFRGTGGFDKREMVRELAIACRGAGFRSPASLAKDMSAQYWKTMVAHWKEVTGASPTGLTLRILRLKTSNPFKCLHQVVDTSTGVLESGSKILDLIPRDCAKKYPAKNNTIPQAWVQYLIQSRGKVCQRTLVQELRRRQVQEKGLGISVESILAIKPQLDSATSGVDCLVPKAVKKFGPVSLLRLAQLLSSEFSRWPEAIKVVLHLTLHKAEGFEVNKCTRPIKLMSALLRLLSKVWAPVVQQATESLASGHRQFSGY